MYDQFVGHVFVDHVAEDERGQLDRQRLSELSDAAEFGAGATAGEAGKVARCFDEDAPGIEVLLGFEPLASGMLFHKTNDLCVEFSALRRGVLVPDTEVFVGGEVDIGLGHLILINGERLVLGGASDRMLLRRLRCVRVGL